MQNIHSYFVPECYFDTVLFRKILQTNARLKHTKGCYNVVNRFRVINGRRGDLFDSPFGVGMVDKDNRDLDYLKECYEVAADEMLLLWRHNDKSKKHYIIQLNPPLENWVIKILNRNNLKIEDFGYSTDFKKLKKQIKDDIDKESDEKLNKLIKSVVNLDDEVIVKLKKVLLHLWEKNLDANDEILKTILVKQNG
jgi:hypothetical protein